MLGLSERNIELLQQGRPIRFELAELPPGTMDTVRRIGICYGITEADIVREMKAATGTRTN